jgi:hypothetical protein
MFFCLCYAYITAVRDEDCTKEGQIFYFIQFLSSYSLEMAGAAADITKCHGIASHA